METKLIKTCHGLVEVRFHEGALVSPDVGEIQTWESLQWVELPPEMIADLNRITLEAFQRDEAERAAVELSGRSRTSHTAQAAEQVSEELHRKMIVAAESASTQSKVRRWWRSMYNRLP